MLDDCTYKTPSYCRDRSIGITIVMYEIESDVTQYAQNLKFNLTVGFKVSRDVRQRMNVTEI